MATRSIQNFGTRLEQGARVAAGVGEWAGRRRGMLPGVSWAEGTHLFVKSDFKADFLIQITELIHADEETHFNGNANYMSI